MRKLKKNQKKQIKKTIVLMLILVCAINLAVYPESFSKYVDNKDKALVYQANLYQLHSGEITIHDTYFKETSNYETARFAFHYERHGNILVDPNTYLDEYQVKELPDSCKVTSIVSGNKQAVNNLISFKKDEKENVPITVNVECNVEKITQNRNLIIAFPIYEHVNDDDESFVYKDVNIVMPVDEYFAIFKKPEAIRSDDLKTLIMPDNLKNKNAEFQRWLIDFAGMYKDEYMIADYDVSSIKNYGLNVFQEQKEFTLKGMSVDCSSDPTQCVYTINSENFVGYAKTATSAAPNQMYFSGIDTYNEQELDEIFMYYLNSHVYPGNSENAQKVYDYILDKSNGLKNIISGNVSVVGLNYDSGKQSFTLMKQVLDLADLGDTLAIDIGKRANMEGEFGLLFDEYSKAHPEIFTENIINTIWYDDNLWNSVMKNACENNNCSVPFELHPYNDYFIEKDSTTGEYVIANIFSFAEGEYDPDGDNTNNKTMGTFEKFDYSGDLSKIDIKFTNSEGKLTIEVTGDTKETILEVIKALDEYFQTSTLEEDIKFTGTTNGVYEIDTKLMQTMKIPYTDLKKPEANKEVQTQKENQNNEQSITDILNIPVTKEKELIKEFIEKNIKDNIEEKEPNLNADAIKDSLESVKTPTTTDPKKESTVVKDEGSSTPEKKVEETKEEIKQEEITTEKEDPNKDLKLLIEFILIDFKKLLR